jgi:hypothetical protein
MDLYDKKQKNFRKGFYRRRDSLRRNRNDEDKRCCSNMLAAVVAPSINGFFSKVV